MGKIRAVHVNPDELTVSRNLGKYGRADESGCQQWGQVHTSFSLLHLGISIKAANSFHSSQRG